MVVAKAFKCSSAKNVQAVRSMSGLSNILSLVARRRSRFYVTLIVSFFFKIVLFSTVVYVALTSLLYLLYLMVVLCLYYWYFWSVANDFANKFVYYTQ